MVRETRGSSSATQAQPAPDLIKRKRSSQTELPSSSSNPLKVTLPSPSSLQTQPHAQTIPKVKLNISPSKVNGASHESGDDHGEGSSKRQKISLRVNGVAGKSHVEEKDEDLVEHEEGMEEEGNIDEDTGEPKEEEGEESGFVFEDKVKADLSKVIAKMAEHLPRPLNDVLSLHLPPSFDRVDTNTIGYLLQKPSLTWEQLVETFHIFTSHLLQPCSYPTPFPSLSTVDQPVPPLLPHQPRHAIYDFCLSLRNLILSLQPASLETPSKSLAKFALMMRIPPTGDGKASDWWTSTADYRALARLENKTNEEKSKGETEASVKEEDKVGVLESMAKGGDKFGLATPVSLVSLATGNSHGAKLGDTIIRKASLKAQKWKEQLARKRGGFGSSKRPVTVPFVSPLPWTPSFAPIYDSYNAAGGTGYWETLDAMHWRNQYLPWQGRVVRPKTSDKTPKEDSFQEYWGTLDNEVDNEDVEMDALEGDEGKNEKDVGRKKEVEDKLKNNEELLNELIGWQEHRVKVGMREVGKREQVVAEALLSSLSQLSSSQRPSDLFSSEIQPGLAHTLAKRFLPQSAHPLRGTLDSSRPKAIHDNNTIRAKPPPQPITPSIASQLAGTPSRPSSQQVVSGQGYPLNSASSSSSYQRQQQSYLGNNTSTPQNPNLMMEKSNIYPSNNSPMTPSQNQYGYTSSSINNNNNTIYNQNHARSNGMTPQYQPSPVLNISSNSNANGTSGSVPRVGNGPYPTTGYYGSSQIPMQQSRPSNGGIQGLPQSSGLRQSFSAQQGSPVMGGMGNGTTVQYNPMINRVGAQR